MTRRAVAALLQRIAPQTQRRDPVLAGEAASTHHGATPPGPKAAAAAPRAGQGQRARICPCSPWPAGRSPLGQAGHRRQLPEEASGAGAAGEGSRKRVTAPGTAGKDSAGGARQPSALPSAATRLGGAADRQAHQNPRAAAPAGMRPATATAGSDPFQPVTGAALPGLRPPPHPLRQPVSRRLRPGKFAGFHAFCKPASAPARNLQSVEICTGSTAAVCKARRSGDGFPLPSALCQGRRGTLPCFGRAGRKACCGRRHRPYAWPSWPAIVPASSLPPESGGWSAGSGRGWSPALGIALRQHSRHALQDRAPAP